VLDTSRTGHSILERGTSKTTSTETMLRAIVGGALASAFIAASFSNFIPNEIISDGAFTTGAALVGGLVGKFYLI
jgi:hypothetical protein